MPRWAVLLCLPDLTINVWNYKLVKSIATYYILISVLQGGITQIG